jgi:hypothetical protein
MIGNIYFHFNQGGPHAINPTNQQNIVIYEILTSNRYFQPYITDVH